MEGLNLMSSSGNGRGYRGYFPSQDNRRRIMVMLQVHGGGWVRRSNESATNNFFCQRIVKLCDVIVVAVPRLGTGLHQRTGSRLRGWPNHHQGPWGGSTTPRPALGVVEPPPMAKMRWPTTLWNFQLFNFNF